MRATQEVLHTTASDDPSLGEAVRLFEQLSAHGRGLDDDLRRLEREPDKPTIVAAHFCLKAVGIDNISIVTQPLEPTKK